TSPRPRAPNPMSALQLTSRTSPHQVSSIPRPVVWAAWAASTVRLREWEAWVASTAPRQAWEAWPAWLAWARPLASHHQRSRRRPGDSPRPCRRRPCRLRPCRHRPCRHKACHHRPCRHRACHLTACHHRPCRHRACHLTACLTLLCRPTACLTPHNRDLAKPAPVSARTLPGPTASLRQHRPGG
ncbi:ADAM29, partial [Symbiodinium sp. CCMP2456]